MKGSSDMQLAIGRLDPTKRGSKPITSNRARTEAGRASGSARIMSTPDPPGPPGLTNRVPIFFDRFLAGSLARAKAMVAPLGLDQSSGTRAVAHSSGAPHERQVSLGTTGPVEAAAATGAVPSSNPPVIASASAVANGARIVWRTPGDNGIWASTRVG